MSARELIERYLDQVYTRENPSIELVRDWQTVLHAGAIYPVHLCGANCSDETATLKVYGKPKLKRFLLQLADGPENTTGNFQQGNSTFAFYFRPQTVLNALDDFFDEE
ncbi:hypothetical protein JDV02_003155 [Purpureocillium takamizusanense]|uniref:Uncharacterized protein n=1 Tax=Purpureocillium takamizusanense TaxID=2060973 RepID=A0A9Q8V9J4_9HYPO|nr:uncharacterized protein JDV02_003155 [Purpureocillium takamizusanense]UNI16746.1 hypothetical protein JDV02_003155 [Purpureocillium takamizusanense]